MKDVGQRTAEATALKHAVPYIRIFKGKTFVLKAGGGALEREATARALVEQVDVLHQVGIRVVLVHGGCPPGAARPPARRGRGRTCCTRWASASSWFTAAARSRPTWC